ncbi:MAG: ABC transporter substrate-binding protein [Chloroflexi bacterium]|nr:ABC transporter substrate-binding protein [Chloroflexota bacterium]
MRARMIVALLGVALLSVLLVACSAPTMPATPQGTLVEQPTAPQATSQAVASPPLRPPTHVKFGSPGVSTDISVFIGMERGYFQQEGIETEFVPFSTGPETLPALVTNEIQIAGGSANAAFYNAAARGLELKLVADKGGCWTNTCYYALVVRKDLIDSGQFRDFADLRGRKISLNSRGVNLMVNLVAALSKGGLTEQDVELVEMGPTDALIGLANGALDAAMLLEPQVAQGVSQGVLVRWKGGDDLLPYYQQGGVLMYGSRFIAEHPEVARRWMVGYVRALRDYYDAVVQGRDRTSILDLLVKYTSLKDRSVLERVVLHTYNPDGYVNVEALQEDLNVFLQLGVVQQPVDLRTVVDHQFVDYAIQRLGRYAP